MNLQEFYKNIPAPTAPKAEFIKRVAEELEVSEPTVRGWVNGRFKPRHPSLYRGLSEITGIPEDQLFTD